MENIPTQQEVKEEAIKQANRSQFLSNYPYDHKSVEYGFIEGIKWITEKLKNK
jgi:hypothetical protein